MLKNDAIEFFLVVPLGVRYAKFKIQIEEEPRAISTGTILLRTVLKSRMLRLVVLSI